MTRSNVGKEFGKSVGRATFGALVGAGGAFLFLSLLGKPDLGERDLSSLLAVIAGLSFFMMGLIVTLGAFAPSAGALFLNVENAEDLREQRSTVGLSAVSMILIGLIFLVLVAASTPTQSGLLPGGMAVTIACACLAGTIALHFAMRRRYDELVRQVSNEASGLAMHVALFLIIVWAGLEVLGYERSLSALGWASLFALIELVAIFWVCGRRGLLTSKYG